LNLGIDVSNNNGHIDWDLLGRTGVSLAMVKVSEGDWFVDQFAATNILGAKRAGMLVGAYHYATPSASDPLSEVQLFHDCLSVLPPVDLTALDLEDPNVRPGVNLSEWAGTWLMEAELDTFHTPRLYSSRWYIASHHLTEINNASHYKLWLAAWTSTEPPSVAPWKVLDGWQFAAGVAWPGIPSVDLSLWAYR
jgi:lysozyme